MVLAEREARVGPGGAPARARPARRALEGGALSSPPRACGVCAGGVVRSGASAHRAIGGVAGWVCKLCALFGGPKSLGGLRFFIFFIQPSGEKKNPNPLYPFLLKSVQSVQGVQYPIYPHQGDPGSRVIPPKGGTSRTQGSCPSLPPRPAQQNPMCGNRSVREPRDLRESG